jgi:hypothetical protein
MRLDFYISTTFSGSQNIWIIGSSIISNAEEHTKYRPTGRTMGFERQELNVLWAGMPGIRLSYIVHMAMEDIRNDKTVRQLKIR